MPQFFELHRLRFLQWMTISPISSPKKNPTLRPKPIPYTSFCQNIPRICSVVSNFSAEVCHGHPHKLKIFHCNMSPDFFCDVTLCNYIFLCIFRECLSLIVLNPDSNLFLCWIKQGQTLIIQGVPPQAGSAVPGFRAQGTPLLAQQPPAAPPLPNAGKLAGRTDLIFSHLLLHNSVQLQVYQ